MNYHNVQFETSFGTASQLPGSDLPEIAFAGRSNVGKSSMINKLFNRRQLARVSAVPGKTATINFFRCGGIRFVDLPGYGYAKVSKGEKRRWSELIGGYFAQDRQLPFVVVLTKADKLSQRERQQRLEALLQELPCADQILMIPFSSQTGEGVDRVKEVVAQIEADCAPEG